MEHSIFLREGGISLEPILPVHVTQDYVSWLNDPETVKHTEQAGQSHTAESVRRYLEANLEMPHSLIWRILMNSVHVGNIRLSGFTAPHSRGTIALLIGQVRGQGIGTTAIRLVSNYACDGMKLHKLVAGIYSTNIPCRRAFEKADFHLEATLKEHAWQDGRFIDVWQMARFSPIPVASN